MILKTFRIHIMSYPCWFRKVDCDGEVFFLHLPPVGLRLVGTRLPRCCHSDALLLCFLLVFLDFLMWSSGRMTEIKLNRNTSLYNVMQINSATRYILQNDHTIKLTTRVCCRIVVFDYMSFNFVFLINRQLGSQPESYRIIIRDKKYKEPSNRLSGPHIMESAWDYMRKI